MFNYYDSNNNLSLIVALYIYPPSYNANKIKNDTINDNNDTASANENP